MHDDELSRLRRRAYSREGTPDDLRRLGELERSVAGHATSSGEILPTAQPRDDTPPLPDDAPPTADLDAPPAPRRPLGPRRSVILAALVGLLVGALATWGISSARYDDAEPLDVSALTVFDREPRDVDDPATLSLPLGDIVPSYLDDLELRWVGEGEGWRAYALRASTLRLTQVCLVLDTGDSVASTCAASDDFVDRGLVIGNGATTLRWGPHGTELWVEASTG